MWSVLATEAAVLIELKLLRSGLLVLRGCIVSLLADCAGKGNYISHENSFSERHTQHFLPCLPEIY